MIKISKVADFDQDMPEYEVVVDGEVVGTVFKTWFRNGGVQWTHGSVSIGPVAGRTRAAAVAHLLQSKGIKA